MSDVAGASAPYGVAYWNTWTTPVYRWVATYSRWFKFSPLTGDHMLTRVFLLGMNAVQTLTPIWKRKWVAAALASRPSIRAGIGGLLINGTLVFEKAAKG
ncbi:unnamed protein product, partial [Scytosiphon promiscuus]